MATSKPIDHKQRCWISKYPRNKTRNHVVYPPLNINSDNVSIIATPRPPHIGLKVHYRQHKGNAIASIASCLVGLTDQVLSSRCFQGYTAEYILRCIICGGLDPLIISKSRMITEKNLLQHKNRK